jgi:hypothetical protein
MKKRRRIVKRNIVSANRKTPADPQREVQKNEKNPNCNGAAIVYCNQWECFTRFMCLEEGAEHDRKKAPSENDQMGFETAPHRK